MDKEQDCMIVMTGKERAQYEFAYLNSIAKNGDKNESYDASKKIGRLWSFFHEYGIDANKITEEMFADDVIEHYDELIEAGATINISEEFPKLTAECLLNKRKFLYEKGIRPNALFDQIVEDDDDYIFEREMKDWLEDGVDADKVYGMYKSRICDKEVEEALQDIALLEQYEAVCPTIFPDFINSHLDYIWEYGPCKLLEQMDHNWDFRKFWKCLNFGKFMCCFDDCYYELKAIRARTFVRDYLKERMDIEEFAKKMVDRYGYEHFGEVYYVLLENGGAEYLDANKIAVMIAPGCYERKVIGLPRKEVLRTLRKCKVKLFYRLFGFYGWGF